MDGAAAMLSDPDKDAFTYAKQLPLLKRANRALELILLDIGSPVQRQVSAELTVDAGDTYINPLPSDFLLLDEMFERAVGGTDRDWVYVPEGRIEGLASSDIIGRCAFRNNGIYFPAPTSAREVLLRYQRQLAVIVSENSAEDGSLVAQNYLEAKQAEMCARFIGMDSTVADGIAVREVEPAREMLENIFTKSNQGIRARRRGFTTRNVSSYR
jgi:hypothetical protein